MKQNEIRPPEGSRKHSKRVGRGDASGHGSFSGRGCKGQKARAGNNKIRPGFEGGQTPLIKRLPEKRGFVNPFRIEYSIVNVSQLNIFAENSEVTPQKMLEVGLIKSLKKPVKVLGQGELKIPLVVKANKFSSRARAMIEDQGGKVEEVGDATVD